MAQTSFWRKLSGSTWRERGAHIIHTFHIADSNRNVFFITFLKFKKYYATILTVDPQTYTAYL